MNGNRRVRLVFTLCVTVMAAILLIGAVAAEGVAENESLSGEEKIWSLQENAANAPTGDDCGTEAMQVLDEATLESMRAFEAETGLVFEPLDS